MYIINKIYMYIINKIYTIRSNLLKKKNFNF